MVDFDEREREREREVCRLLCMEFGRGLAIPSLEAGSTHSIPSLCAVCLGSGQWQWNILRKTTSVRMLPSQEGSAT